MEENEQSGLSPAEKRRNSLPVALRDTNLGLFILTRQGRYLLAFVGHIIGVGAMLLMVGTIIGGAANGSLIGEPGHPIFDRILLYLQISSGAFVVASFAETKFANALKAMVVFGIFFFINTLRG